MPRAKLFGASFLGGGMLDIYFGLRTVRSGYEKGAHCWTPSSYSVVPDYVSKLEKTLMFYLFVLHNGAAFKM